MNDKIYKVLFLCTGNSARSIMAEAILSREGHGLFKAFSAGSFPAGLVHPYALDLLRERGHPTNDLSCKSWNEFSGDDAPTLEFIFTVCDNAAKETCPIWPGHPVSAHWGLSDPAAAKGSETDQRAAFAKTYHELLKRIRVFVGLALQDLNEKSLLVRLLEIGSMEQKNV